MKARNLSCRLVAVITFSVGLGAALLSSKVTGPESRPAQAELIGVLTPAREVDYYQEQVKTSDNLLIMGQARSQSISEPVSLSDRDDDLIEHNCGTLLVSISDDGRLDLNGDEIGTLEDFRELEAKLKDIFDDRLRKRVFSWRMQARHQVPENERVYKTVLIKPAPSLTFGEVTRVTEMVRGVGAKPIGIYTNHLESEPCNLAQP